MTEKLISLVNFTTERSGHGFKQGVAHPRLCNHVQIRERERERERERFCMPVKRITNYAHIAYIIFCT